MSASATSKRVRFLGGASPRDDLIGILAFPESLDGTDIEFTRFYMYSAGQWVCQEIKSDITSVSYYPTGSDRGWWLLGKRGDVTSLTATGRHAETIQGAGTGPNKRGYVKKIRVIGESLYAAGYRRQVYVRRQGKWTSAGDSILAARTEVGIGFNDIDGASECDIYAVGNRGEIFHFRDQGWFQVDSSTNVHLEGVVCTGDKVVIVGRDGVVLLGSAQGFFHIGPARPGLNFWDVGWFQGRIFLSASAGVFEVNLEPPYDLKVSVFPQHIGYKLAVSPNKLISLGSHQIFSYDGNVVEEIICPDNLL